MKIKSMNKMMLLLLGVLCVVASSCLKDKGYEDGEYGAVRNTAGQEWVSIPRGANKTNALGVEAKEGAQTLRLFALSYDYEEPVPADFTATLALNNDLVTVADSTVTILPSNAYTMPSMDVLFRQGRRISDTFAINLNTSLLDPTQKYGIGFTLTDVSKSGVQIPSNLKNVVYIFSIKNKYDGIYTFTGTFSHPADRPAEWLRTQFTYPFDVYLLTTGPSSVSFFNTAFNSGFWPLMVPGTSGLGATAMDIVFDANDNVVSVNNPAPDARNRQFSLVSGGNNRYDAASRTLYLEIEMNQNGFAPIPMSVSMKYKAARP